uniref:FK506-binding protein n=1 Tax=Albugo laibachii Nc14 TaxID=890382 RepID=F0X1H7_9STRA|nr:conserved hypothetical protein [Albugo laibachii Nc14]|eukprot:CCA27663.1 conserved hypothetical protein [Albugo laibachii Nc14]
MVKKTDVAKKACIRAVPGFFGHTLRPGEDLVWENNTDEFCLQLSSAALGSKVEMGRTTLFALAKGTRVALCTLSPQVNEQWNVTHTFTSFDGEINFSCDGVNEIHLTGFIDVQNDEEEEESDEDDEDDDGDGMIVVGNAPSEEESDNEPLLVEASEERFEIIAEHRHDDGAATTTLEKPKVKTPKKAADSQASTTETVQTPPSTRKSKAANASSTQKNMTTPQMDRSKGAQVSSSQKKKTVQTPQTPSSGQKRPAAESLEVPKKSPRVVKGVQVVDQAIGKGPAIQKGKQVRVLYKGRLENGEQFDAAMNRKSPFKFRHGVGDVIKGMDFGIEGMRSGGKRTITIPPQLGYGRSGAPPKIPRNATLVFDIEML